MKRRTSSNDSTAANNTPQEAADRPAFPQALLDHVMAHYQKPADLIGENGMLKQRTKAVFEAALNAEMAQHLGHTRHGSVGNPSGNVRNGHSAKTISGDFGEVDITVPRDRDASFSPQLLPRHQRCEPGFDERILSLYARGMSTRQIAAQLHEMLDVEVSPTLSSTITDWVADELRLAVTSARQALPNPLSGLLDGQDARSGQRGQSGPSTWPLVSIPRGKRKCWACGRRRPKGPSSGSRW